MKRLRITGALTLGILAGMACDDVAGPVIDAGQQLMDGAIIGIAGEGGTTGTGGGSGASGGSGGMGMPTADAQVPSGPGPWMSITCDDYMVTKEAETGLARTTYQTWLAEVDGDGSDLQAEQCMAESWGASDGNQDGCADDDGACIPYLPERACRYLALEHNGAGKAYAYCGYHYISESRVSTGDPWGPLVDSGVRYTIRIRQLR